MTALVWFTHPKCLKLWLIYQIDDFFSQYWQILVGAESHYALNSPEKELQTIYWLTLHSIEQILKIVGNVPISNPVIWWLVTSQWGLTVTKRTPEYSFFQLLSSEWTYCINTLCLGFAINVYSGFDLNP